MAILIFILSALLLVLLIVRFKITPFISFVFVSIVAGLFLGLPATNIANALQKGIGDTIGTFVIIVVFGAMLGKLIATSGAAQKISTFLVRVFGVKYIQWALVITGFIVGTTLFYGIGFVLLIPLIFSAVYISKLPAVYIGLPTLAALSVTHGFLPPHPAPVALVLQLKADMGITLLYGLFIAIPAIVVAGPLFSKTVRNLQARPLDIFMPQLKPPEELPGTFASFFCALLPVILLIMATGFSNLSIRNIFFAKLVSLLASPTIVMLLALMVSTWILGIKRGKTIRQIMKIYEEAAKEISPIILIIGGAGGLKQVFMESGLDKLIAAHLLQLHLPLLFMGWLVAALLRICFGSSTVAALMSVGIIAPMMVSSHVNANLMVLAIGSGSMILSHVNDSGFWLFKEYFNLSLKQTFLTFSMMETIVAVMGLIGVFILNSII
jgi:Gnt-I system high-affinity gluconate transporter